MTVHLHQGDLPVGIEWGDSVAVDSETMGLIPGRDRLCLLQLSSGDGDAHLVRFRRPVDDQLPDYAAPNLRQLLTDPAVTKIFHYGRFDIAVLQYYMRVECTPVYCTKIASRLVRTYTDRHGLKDLCRELLGVDLQKEQQSSDWGAETLSEAQCAYAASDVLHLHRLREVLDRRLAREGRTEMAQACFKFLPTRAALDLKGWNDIDIFAHS
jgi:ribonuclease D